MSKFKVGDWVEYRNPFDKIYNGFVGKITGVEIDWEYYDYDNDEGYEVVEYNVLGSWHNPTKNISLQFSEIYLEKTIEGKVISEPTDTTGLV